MILEVDGKGLKAKAIERRKGWAMGCSEGEHRRNIEHKRRYGVHMVIKKER